MKPKPKYAINLEPLVATMESFDLGTLAAAAKDPWYNQTLCLVNDAAVRLGVLEGEFHWHKHDEQDEFFYVVDGELTIELEGRAVRLGPKHGFTVAKGAMHRPIAARRTVVLMLERADVRPTGD